MTLAGRRKLAARILLGLGCCAAALLLLELPALFRVVDYRNIIGANPLHSNYMDDPELVFIHRPNSRLTGSAPCGFAARVYDIPLAEQTAYHWDVRYDRNGFRNATDLTSAETVALGDSCVEATPVPDAQLMTTLLANSGGKAVANLGHNGYGPQQELAVLRRYGLPLRPRTVIWVFSEGTDIGDAQQYGRLTRRESNFWLAFLDRCFTKNALERLRIAGKQPAAQGRGVLHNANGMSNTYFTFADVFSAEPLPKTMFPGLDETVRSLRAAANLCADRGCRAILVYAPDKYRVFHDFCTFPPEFQWRNRPLNDLPKRMAGIVESMAPEMGYLDLTPALMDDVRSGGMPYSIDDGHWNEEGERIAAKALDGYLSTHASGWSAASNRPSRPGPLP
jgi:hypothetical protein